MSRPLQVVSARDHRATWATGAMLTTFGAGLLGPGVAPTFTASLAAIGGATVWVLLATRMALPVSTTHAIVGAVVGAALAAYGVDGIAWSGLLTRVALPLAVSPIVAAALVQVGSRTLTRLRRDSADAVDCVCVAATAHPLVELTSQGVMASRQVALGVAVGVGDTSSCDRAHPGAARLTADHAHWLSSGAVSFARGLNDAPKIVALALGAAALAPASPGGSPAWSFALVCVAMTAGSVLGGRRVTHRLAEGVTPMSHREGLMANTVAALLVTSGALSGLPMSTTHVASGGIIGIGFDRGSLDWTTVRAMALAWVVTVPGAALLGAMAFAAGRVIVSRLDPTRHDGFVSRWLTLGGPCTRLVRGA